MYLSDPTLTLTLPSIHDGTVLDCRVYHPPGDTAPGWRPNRSAVVAHPYAPLGGSYDDPIVAGVASMLLLQEFVVATFNFRGGGNSAGRTSWTSKPERDDYNTVTAFLVYYTHNLEVDRPADDPPPILVLSGYSYGAMITSQLPPLPAMLAPFASPTADTYAAHVRERAENLARQQRDLMPAHSAIRRVLVGDGGSPTSPPSKNHGSRRRSCSVDDETRERSGKGVRDFVRRTRQRAGSSLGSGPQAQRTPETTTPPQTLSQVADLVHPRPAYILVSPLQGVILHLATLSRWPGQAVSEAQLRLHPTIAVYGGQDVFVSAAKLRAWTERMEEADGSKFHGCEIANAGHFWVEEGAMTNMLRLVDEFARGVIGRSVN